MSMCRCMSRTGASCSHTTRPCRNSRPPHSLPKWHLLRRCLTRPRITPRPACAPYADRLGLTLIRCSYKTANVTGNKGDEMSAASPLRLPSLSIEGFRGIENLTISRLGRVSLILGRNSIGKTTALEAIQAYASRGRGRVLSEILMTRDETARPSSLDEPAKAAVAWPTLFFGREPVPSATIELGPGGTEDQLTLKVEPLSEPQQGRFFRLMADQLDEEPPLALKAVFRMRETIVAVWPPSEPQPIVQDWSREMGGRRRPTPRDMRVLNEVEPFPEIPCLTLGPDRPPNHEVSRFLDKVALTDDESRAIEALRLVLGDAVEGIRIVGDEGLRRAGGRQAIVKLSGHRAPVPLRSLGDGALRMFGIALALANCAGGFLLIDEVENGLHYSLHPDFWRMVLHAAETHDVQVVATTHSDDCWKGLAKALAEVETIEGALIRLSTSRGSLRAVEYSEEELLVAARQRIEVR